MDWSDTVVTYPLNLAKLPYLEHLTIDSSDPLTILRYVSVPNLKTLNVCFNKTASILRRNSYSVLIMFLKANNCKLKSLTVSDRDISDFEVALCLSPLSKV